MNDFKKTYYLPEQLRPELKKPWGIPVLGAKNEVVKECEKIIKQKGFEKVITVGDYCSLVIPSHVKIFDGKVERKKVKNTLPYSLKCDNPAGTIQEQVWSVIEKAISEHKNVFVEGEEDLLVIPSVLLSEKNTAVIYGFVGKGVCIIEVSPEIKEQFKNILKKFNTTLPPAPPIL
jgi:uncharacterized protein (UPF0218 family)